MLENAYIRVELNALGDITRIYDKTAKRNVLPNGSTANQFLAFEDIPLSWDAWDIDIFYDDKVWLAEAATSIEVIEEGPYRATLEIKRRILNSGYTQRISLTHNSPRLDFDTCIDWQERQILLKVAFPVNVLTPTATYEIQWGNVERPTHRNTSWDWARFETAAQKWVDLSEGDYGVSLLNDCKYGHDIRDNVMRLTLLRGTTAPDPDADYGEHTFKYSLLPHEGSWGIETVREAYALNDPLVVYQTEDGRLGTENSIPSPRSSVSRLPSFVSVDRDNIIVETIKRAEDGNGIIIRMYECQRQRGEFNLKTVFPIGTAYRTNILEENQEEIPISGTQLRYTIKPYQILTLRLTMKQPHKAANILANYNARLLEHRIVTDLGSEYPPEVEVANLKFEENGAIKPYYGLTCISWIDPQSQLYQKLLTLQSSIQTELRGESLNDEFAFLKPESFHMTICDIAAGSSPLTQTEVETVRSQIHASFSPGFTMESIQAQVIGIGLKSTITALVRFTNEDELKKIHQLETRIKKATQVNVREFLGHISLAYCVKSPAENMHTLRGVLQPYQNRNLGEFTISEFDLTCFTNMNTYIPLTTVDFENGKVSDYDNLDKCQLD